MQRVEPSRFETALEVKPESLTLFEALNVGGLYSDAGLALHPIMHQDYQLVGGRTTAEYKRPDSPSRLESDAPYNVTLDVELRKQYRESIDLLVALRSTFLERKNLDFNKRPKPDIILDVYGMGVHLPAFLHSRSEDRYTNGNIPSHVAMLRQGLLGIGTIIIFGDKRKLRNITGAEIVEEAENNSELVGPKTPTIAGSDLEQTVCPAANKMIESMSNVLLDGDESREIDREQILGRLGLGDLVRLEKFQRTAIKHHHLSIKAGENLGKILSEQPNVVAEKSIKLLEQYSRDLSKLQKDLFKQLGRSGYKHKLDSEDLLHDSMYRQIVFMVAEIIGLDSDYPVSITTT